MNVIQTNSPVSRMNDYESFQVHNGKRKKCCGPEKQKTTIVIIKAFTSTALKSVSIFVKGNNWSRPN